MIEDELLSELKTSFIARKLSLLKEQGELGDFVEFAREQCKKDGMDTKALMDFFDSLEELTEDEEKSDINWFKFQVRMAEVCPFKSQVFRGDNSFIVESEVLTNRQISEFVEYEKAPLNIETFNDAIRDMGLELEFVEALNNPFDLNGFQNFIRFKVKKLD